MTNQTTNNSPHTRWTDERNDRLRELWATGLSCAKIAARLGGTTRNAVIGKAHRLGLESRQSPISFDAGSDRTTQRRITRAHKQIHAVVAPLFVDAPARPAPPVIVGSSTEKCQWPHGNVGEPGFGFCGEASAAGRPYCAEHVRRAYLPPKKRVA